MIRLAGKLLLRDMRSRDQWVLAASLIVSITIVTIVVLLNASLEQRFLSTTSQFLAADRQLKSPREVPDDWLQRADQLGLQQARITEFSTMLMSGERMQLVSVKAVSDSYPLRGDLSIEPSARQEVVVDAGPPAGEAWISGRLFSMLDLELGQSVQIGRKSLRITALLKREPDTGFSLGMFAPRVLMNQADVAATNVIQPGSRISYVYLFAGSDEALSAMGDWLTPKLVPSQRWIGVKEGRPAVSRALERAETFLVLGGSLAVLLSALAVSLTAYQFSERQAGTVALLKTLGLTRRGVAAHYAVRLLLLTLCASVVGSAAGWGGFSVVTSFINQYLQEPLLPPESLVWLLASGAAALMLLVFAAPSLRRLLDTSPMVVIREPKQTTGWTWRQTLPGLVVMIGLLWGYTENNQLVVILAGAVLIPWILARLVVAAVRRYTRSLSLGAGSPLALAVAAINRHPGNVTLQVFAFSLALVLLVVIYLLRTSLISEWQQQLPAGTPNHFLINIAPYEVEPLSELLADNGIERSAIYPMVRGRLSHINGQDVKETVSKEQNINALNRELNLTWADSVAPENSLIAGDWWDKRTGDMPWVSIEKQLADRLGVSLGDDLTFTIGSEQVTARLSSVREVQWDSMRPNFYMVFNPGALSSFIPSHISSFYLPPGEHEVVTEIGRQFPTISVLDLTQVIDRVREVMTQVAQAIELIMSFILVAAVLTVVAIVNSTLGVRMHEAVLLRTLGASDALVVRSVLLEFGLLGLVVGLFAAGGGEGTLWLLQIKLFDMSPQFHWAVWVMMPALAAGLVAWLGYMLVRTTVKTPPVVILRSFYQ